MVGPGSERGVSGLRSRRMGFKRLFGLCLDGRLAWAQDLDQTV